jgi:hypothetical protein
VLQRICKAISQETGRNKTLLTRETVTTTLNRIMIGWLIISVGTSQSCLSSCRTTCSQEVATVAVRQAQAARAGNEAVFNYRPASGVGPCRTYYSDEQLSVGETVNLSPRAGCGKSACPVACPAKG